MTDAEKAIEAWGERLWKRKDREAPLKGALDLAGTIINDLIDDLHKRIAELEERVKRLEDK
jgi:hypothetical protein